MKRTELVIEEASKRFENRFKHPPRSLNGNLIMDNKTIFQKAYAAEVLRLRRAKQSIDEQAVGARALKETPFYKARERDYDVTLKKLSAKEFREILYGDPPELVRVPSSIEADAVRKK